LGKEVIFNWGPDPASSFPRAAKVGERKHGQAKSRLPVQKVKVIDTMQVYEPEQ